jgi:hypothetical protein
MVGTSTRALRNSTILQSRRLFTKQTIARRQNQFRTTYQPGKYNHKEGNVHKLRNNKQLCWGHLCTNQEQNNQICSENAYMVLDSRYKTSQYLMGQQIPAKNIAVFENDLDTYKKIIENNQHRFQTIFGGVSEKIKDTMPHKYIWRMYLDYMGCKLDADDALKTIKICADDGRLIKGTVIAITLSGRIKLEHGKKQPLHKFVDEFIANVGAIQFTENKRLKNIETYGYRITSNMVYLRFLLTNEECVRMLRPHKIVDANIHESKLCKKHEIAIKSESGAYDLVKYFGFNNICSRYYPHGTVDISADLIVF